eukprot:TRINITY_DN106729_c0_g1_i1.p1 TRINITY_DN106729_c0_g1~~TRINITY_DN106729_c0_g1_i1.p1  ORF type:complete len:631 (+),score=112.12 TRINITY_DN106729_c0_g1_i1:85-1977(+)
MLQAVTPEAKRAQAKTMKEEGNLLAKEGNKAEAAKKYEKGIRLLGLLNYELDEDGLKALEGHGQETRELLSILAGNAAQMYMDPSDRQLSKAIERCSLAIEVNPSNAKAYFRRATAAYDYADNVAKGADAILAQAQKDIRKFLQLDQDNVAGKALQERLARKRQVLLGPIMREKGKAEPEVEPEWYQQVSKRAIFVCMCGSSASGRDQTELPDALLSMASQAKDKKAISVGVAYVGFKPPDELEMFTEEWQKKYYRMLRLGERATKVPKPRQVVVHGEVYNVWSLLEGRLRVMRVGETRRSGEKVGLGWMRYCAQLLWHGEPFVFQSCRPYLRFAPMWDEWLRNDLAVALRRSQMKPVISWSARQHEDEVWQWVSQLIDYEGNCNVPSGALVADGFDKHFGWIRFKRRYFCHAFGVPSPIAFFTPYNAFSTSDILTEVPSDPCMNSLHFHGQLTCENIRLHTHGWDVFTPCANFTWETNHDSRLANSRLFGNDQEPYCRDMGANPELFSEQKVRADALLDPWENRLTPMDEEILEMPVPTPVFWTTIRPNDATPWDIGQQVGHRFKKGSKRMISSFERACGVDMTRLEVDQKGKNAGFNGDRDFEDSHSAMQSRYRQFNQEAAPEDQLAW